MSELERTDMTLGRATGPSPAENRCYVMVMFDVSNVKKYTKITKLLRRYCSRIQNSVYEGYLKASDYRALLEGLERLMGSERFFDPGDKVRVYRLTGSCTAVTYGPCSKDKMLPCENLFI